MGNINYFGPIRVFGFYFLLCAFICIILHFTSLSKPYYTIEFQFFVLLMGLFHFLIGIGIFLKRRWGFHI